jgi:hypothetical protein
MRRGLRKSYVYLQRVPLDVVIAFIFGAASVSPHFLSYNFARPHETLTKRYGRKATPAMAAGVAEHVWHGRELVQLLEA